MVAVAAAAAAHANLIYHFLSTREIAIHLHYESDSTVNLMKWHFRLSFCRECELNLSQIKLLLWCFTVTSIIMIIILKTICVQLCKSHGFFLYSTCAHTRCKLTCCFAINTSNRSSSIHHNDNNNFNIITLYSSSWNAVSLSTNTLRSQFSIRNGKGNAHAHTYSIRKYTNLGCECVQMRCTYTMPNGPHVVFTI